MSISRLRLDRICPHVVVVAVIAGVAVAGCKSIDTQQVFAKARKGVDALAKVPTLDSLLHRPPVTTSFADATTEIPFLDESLPEGAEGFPLSAVPRDANGNYLLTSGLYEVNAESYCIQAGTYGPSKGDGYLYAPLRGAKADIVQSVLRRSAAKPEIPQHEVQLLLWAIVARTPLRNMPTERQRTAAAILTPKELFDLNGGALGLIPPELLRRYLEKLPVDARKVFQLEQQLRQRLTSATATYEQIEEIAVLAGLAPPGHVTRPTPRGRWSYHPNGYFIRFFPSSYRRTRFQVYIPPPITVERDDQGRIVAVDDGVLFRVETKYTTQGNASPSSVTAHAFKELRIVARNSSYDKKTPDSVLIRKNKGSVFVISDAEEVSEAAAASSTTRSRRDRLTVAARKLAEGQTLPGDRAALANLTDYSAAVRESLGSLTTKEAWAAAAMPLLDHAVESELYMTMSGRTNERGHWRIPNTPNTPALVTFDPTANVAAPANTSSQRLVSGGVPEGRPGERWFEKLPDCPCSWRDIPFGQKITDKSGRSGVWRDTADWRTSPSGLHPGAEREARWTADAGGAGQQCTYKAGRLITGGLAAGTPDLNSPGEWWWNPGQAYLHFREDVAPYKHFRWLIRWMFDVDDYSCDVYVHMYPPNSGSGCPAQVIAPVDPTRATSVPCLQLIEQK